MSPRLSAAPMKSSLEDPSLVARNSILSGSGAGMCSTLLCHPFDVIRIKMQSAAFQNGASDVTASGQQRLGPIATLKKTVRLGGTRSLWAGLSLPLAAQAVYKACVFGVNNITQHFLIEYHTKKIRRKNPESAETYQLSVIDRFWCGFTGGAVNGACFVTPVEFVRNQLINNPKRPSSRSGPLGVIIDALQRDSALSLWRGTVSTVARDSVGCGFFFVTMAKTQEWMNKMFPPVTEGNQSLSSIVASGGAAGLSFWLWSLPIDTCKTWIQAGRADNLSHALRIARCHPLGFASLFQGFQVAYGRGIPSAAITVTTYSLIYQHLSKD